MGEGAIQRTASVPTWHLGLALGVLSCLGPLSIDLYLPAFPALVREFAATPGDVQRTLSVFLLALATAQIPFGSFGDRHGRKPALYLGLLVFVAASLACALSKSIHSLIALRFVQGCGICAGTAVSRAMIRDLRSGPEAARLMAFTFLIIGMSPILAPLIGSFLLTFVSWRGLFVLLSIAGLGGLLIVRFGLVESLAPEQRRPKGVAAWRPYARLLRNGRFLSAAVVAGLATTIPYAYVTAAPFVLSGRFGLDARSYSILLGIDSVCSIGMAQLSPFLMRRWGAKALLVRMSGAGVAACLALVAVNGADELNLAAFQLLSMLVFGVVGLLLTPAAVSALDAGSTGAGGGAGATAAALGTLTLIITAAASATMSLFPAFSVVPLLAAMGASLGLALLISLRLKPDARPSFNKRNYAE
jgi:MFS transporter, DHA1 family, multidrug resistance protein